METFDTIVVGSGFGGAVMTCRLAERGHRVCLLERGREYGMHGFPRRMEDLRDRMPWDPPNQRYGYIELRDYPESDVATVSASGLGGGSLIYANVLMRMPEEHFAGWPGGITRTTLDPYYDRVAEMLEASPYPFEINPYYAETPKTRAFKEAAGRLLGSEDAAAPPEFLFPDLAVRFSGDFPGHQTPNNQGVIQSSCTKCGECAIGCNIHAKNTLDLTYIARARSLAQSPAEVRSQAEVSTIRPGENGGYVVSYADPEHRAERHEIAAQRVVVSAGSIGSTGLLLRMKRDGHLPGLSGALGRKWCGNGDLEGTVLLADEALAPTVGPVITSAIQYRYGPYPDGFPHGAVIQDAGLPVFIGWYLAAKLPSPRSFWRGVKLGVNRAWGWVRNLVGRGRKNEDLNLGSELISLLDDDAAIRHTLILLGMGRDRSTGRIELRSDGEPVVRWQLTDSELHFQRLRNEMGKIARALGGRFVENPLSALDKVIAVHPLGGCPMAETPNDGVVGPNGEAFGHPGLYVVDASILPTSVGPNPSLTIAALAEYIAEGFPVP